MLRSRKTRGEEPIDDVHVPDPMSAAGSTAEPEDEAVLADSVGLALLVVLETLSPGGAAGVRAARHVRGAVRRDRRRDRQVAGRDAAAGQPGPAPGAGRHRRYARPTAPRQREVVEAFLAASRGGNFEALVAVLDPDVVLRVDYGTSGPARRRWSAVPSGWRRTLCCSRSIAPYVRLVSINGMAGTITVVDGALFSVMSFTVVDGKVVEIDILADPGRLAQLEIPESAG